MYLIKKIVKGVGIRVDLLLRFIVKQITKSKNLKECIVIESHNDFDCNGGAFYNYLIEHKYNKKYKIVWLIKNDLNRKLPYNVVAYNIYRPSWGKNKYICLAKWLLSDNDITSKVRSDQISIYCTHGGVTIKNVKGVLVVPDDVDYILSPSERFDKQLCENYSIPYPNERMLHIGYPCNDNLFLSVAEVRKISRNKYCKILLWMPTFRKSKFRNDSTVDSKMGIPLFESMEELIEFNRYLQNKNSLLIIKLHPMQDLDTVKSLKGLSNIIILDAEKTKKIELDIYKLMSCADALISDYSSVTYSYLLLDRPIGFVLSDLNNYKLGLAADDLDKFIPGERIYNIHDFTVFAQNVIEGKNDEYERKRQELIPWIYDYRDGNSCKRLVEFMNL